MEMNQYRSATAIVPMGIIIYNLKLVRLRIYTHAVAHTHVRLYIYIYIYIYIYNNLLV